MSNPENIQKLILEDLNEIPPLPTIVVKVMQMTKDPDVSASQLNKVISMDQSLTANILKLCNSAYYGLPRVISSVTQAIMYLGFHTVRNLVMTSSIHDMYDADMTGYGYYDKGGLWKHSVATAIASQVLCKKYRPGLDDTAFTGGLLHDVGKIVMNKYLLEHNHNLMAVVESDKISVLEAETKVVGCNHAEIGARIADSWNFPQELVQTIGFHHKPESAKGRPLLTILVHMADMIAHRAGYGLDNWGETCAASKYAFAALNIEEEQIVELIENLQTSMADAESFFSMD